MRVSVDVLFDVLKTEKKTGELLPIDKDFYNEAEKTLNMIDDQAEKQNLAKTLNNIKEKRIQKLLVYLAYNKELPSPTPFQEEDLYNQIKKILKKESQTPNQTRVRITAEVPQIITTNGNKIGPFRQNEIVTVNDAEDTKFIIENKIGEIV